jgi:hypothetical protein
MMENWLYSLLITITTLVAAHYWDSNIYRMVLRSHTSMINNVPAIRKIKKVFLITITTFVATHYWNSNIRVDTGSAKKMYTHFLSFLSLKCIHILVGPIYIYIYIHISNGFTGRICQ